MGRTSPTPARSARSSCSASPGLTGRTTAAASNCKGCTATAFFNQKDLDAYLHQVEEAKKRDHRLLGKQLKLFTISQMAGGGLILWMPKGALIRSLLENFIRDELMKRGYQPVYTPHIGRLELYRTSGHFPYYRDAQYPPMYAHPAARRSIWPSIVSRPAC